MLNNLALKFLEMSEGRALASVLSEITDISDRTLRKPDFSLSQSRIEKSKQYSRKYVLQKMIEAGYSETEMEDWLSQHPCNQKPGMLYSSLVFNTQVKGVFEYPCTMELARKIDELSSRLFEARVADDLTEFKKKLMSSQFADPAYFAQDAGEMALSHPPMLEQFQSSCDWEELKRPLAILQVNVLFSLLAHWDVEFCPQFFPSFAHRSCFSMVLPRIDPKAIREDGSIAKRRDMFWRPIRRLIDMVACIGEFVRSKHRPGRWPDNVPSVKKIVTQDNSLPQTLTNWRDGTKRFTRHDFAGLWWQLCPEHHPAVPLLVAALFWELLFVDILMKWKTIKIFEDVYNAWWHRHYKISMGSKEILKLADWPSCFKKL